MLNDIEKYDSFDAVKKFLFDGEKFVNGGLIPCFFDDGHGPFETEILISCVDHIPSYNLDDIVFKSYGLRNPIWSAYKYLKWNNENKELIITVDQYRSIRLKRLK